MTEKDSKTLDATLRLFTAQHWAYTPDTIARWMHEHTNSHVTAAQVAEYIQSGVQLREIGQWSNR